MNLFDCEREQRETIYHLFSVVRLGLAYVLHSLLSQHTVSPNSTPNQQCVRVYSRCAVI